MKNLNNLEAEKLDSLPKYHSTHRHTGQHGCHCSWCYERHGRGFPRRRADRFLKSKVGQKWAHVSSLWTHAEWLEPMYREYHKLTELVETHTFIEDGRVAFYDKYCHHYGRDKNIFHQFVDEQSSAILYVHPVSKTLCFQKAESKAAQKARWEDARAKNMVILGDYHQLLKLDGIWYEVWADPDGKHVKSHFGPHTPLLYSKKESDKFFSSVWFIRQSNWLYPRPKINKRQLSKEQLKQFNLQNDIK